MDTTKAGSKGKKGATPAFVPSAEVADARTDMQRLEEACPGVAAAIKLLVHKGGVHGSSMETGPLRSISPGFVKRALDEQSTRMSSLDMLHDLVYDTELYHSNARNDADYRTAMATKVGEWAGAVAASEEAAASATDGGSSSSKGGRSPRPTAVNKLAAAENAARVATAGAVANVASARASVLPVPEAAMVLETGRSIQ